MQLYISLVDSLCFHIVFSYEGEVVHKCSIFLPLREQPAYHLHELCMHLGLCFVYCTWHVDQDLLCWFVAE